MRYSSGHDGLGSRMGKTMGEVNFNRFFSIFYMLKFNSQFLYIIYIVKFNIFSNILYKLFQEVVG